MLKRRKEGLGSRMRDSNMASCFVKVRAHTEPHPVYTRANQILAALPQVLTSPSSISYYAGLLSLIQGDIDLEPGVLLFALVLQSVPIGVIQSEAAGIYAAVCRLVKGCTGEQSYMGKYCVKVMEKVLQVQPREAWERFEEGTVVVEVLGEMVTLAGDKRAPLHKQASSSLLTLLRKGISSFQKPVAFLEARILAVLQNPDIYRKRFDATSNILRFLAGALQVLPPPSSQALLPSITDIATNESNPQLATQAYLSLESAFAGAKLPSITLKESLTKVLRSSPMTGGPESLQQSYIQCLTQLLRGLNSLDAEECYQLLSPGISSLTEYLLSNQSAVQQVAATAITSVILTCVNERQAAAIPKGDELTLTFDKLSLGTHPLPIQKVAATVVYLLNDRFQEIIDLIFPIITAFLGKIGNQNSTLTAKIVLEVEKYAPSHCQRAGFKRAIAAGLNSLGPELFFSVVPMQICSELTNPDYMTISRSWLLPIVAEYMEKGDFGYFLRELFPAYLELETKREAAEKGQIAFLATRLQVLEMQIWLAFPRFCLFHSASESVDSITAFKTMLPKLAKFLSSNIDVRSQICKGLVHIANSGQIGFCNELKSAESKFIPMLFNDLLEKGADKDMLALIREYPLSTDFRGKMVKKAIEKAVKPGEESSKIVTLVDIAIALCVKQDSFTVAQGKILQMFICNFAKHADGLIQKKAYKLANVLYPKINVCETLVSSVEIQSCGECARTERLKCIQNCLLNSDLQTLQSGVVTFMPEILQCVPDQSTKTRKTALDLGVSIGKKMRKEGQLLNYLNLILIGLGSEVGSTKAATITLMAVIIGEILLPAKEIVAETPPEDRKSNENYVVQLLQTVVLTLKDAHREVVKSTITFLKVVITALDTTIVATLAGDLLKSVLEWPSTDVKDAVKVKTRFFLMKLVKKLGFDAVAPLFPEPHIKLLHYINKALKRKNKKKTPKPHSDESENEENDDLPDTENPEMPIEDEDSQGKRAPAEQHFMNPLDIPAQGKRKKRDRAEDAADPDIEYIDGKMHIHEEDDEELDSGQDSDSEHERKTGAKAGKRAKNTEGVAVTVSGEEFKSRRAVGDMQKPGKQQPFAYIEFNPKVTLKADAE